MSGYEEVLKVARGRKSDYLRVRDEKPMRGGQADVFKAVHKPTGVVVALKQLRAPGRHQIERMAREIEVGRLLDGHPHVMPILDADPGNRWFVMPYAELTAEGLTPDERSEDALYPLVRAVCSALAEAHARGWVHRDLKPSNILLLNGVWVIADWGIARGPRGHTPAHQLTRMGVSIGSEGFAPPELSVDAHSAGPQADLYSLGQFIGWWFTGRNPRANRALLPDWGPWRAIVRGATREDPGKRPPSVEAFLALIAREVSAFATSDHKILLSLRRDVDHGSPDAVEKLVSLADTHIDDADFYCDFLVHVDQEKLLPALLADPSRATGIMRAMASLTCNRRPQTMSVVETTVLWLFTTAQAAAEVGQLPLFEECLDGMFHLDAQWNASLAQQRILSWLSTVSGDVASSTADILKNHPGSAIHFAGLTENVRADRRVASVVHDVIAASSLGGFSTHAAHCNG
ncbi:serine/threonine-protein kinase [Streptomyces sp. NPDC047017]|uniref:serine/threonine-protein kinase n=1 Tax=Streptomyces sp. NPDC047017 TaxID=3155024 RepID=UPI0033EF76E7